MNFESKSGLHNQVTELSEKKYVLRNNILQVEIFFSSSFEITFNSSTMGPKPIRSCIQICRHIIMMTLVVFLV